MKFLKNYLILLLTMSKYFKGMKYIKYSLVPYGLPTFNLTSLLVHPEPSRLQA